MTNIMHRRLASTRALAAKMRDEGNADAARVLDQEARRIEMLIDTTSARLTDGANQYIGIK